MNEQPVDFWTEDEFQKILLALTFYIAIEKRINEVIKNDRSFIFLRRLRYFALSLAREFIEIRFPGNITHPLSSAGVFREMFSEFWREAVRALTDAHYQATEVEKTTLFALARSEQRWRATKEKFSRFLRVTATA